MESVLLCIWKLLSEVSLLPGVQRPLSRGAGSLTHALSASFRVNRVDPKCCRWKWFGNCWGTDIRNASQQITRQVLGQLEVAQKVAPEVPTANRLIKCLRLSLRVLVQWLSVQVFRQALDIKVAQRRLVVAKLPRMFRTSPRRPSCGSPLVPDK